MTLKKIRSIVNKLMYTLVSYYGDNIYGQRQYFSWTDPSVQPLASEERDADIPTIQLDEMLGGLTLQDNVT